MKPALSHGYRLQWEAVQNAHVLLYPEGMVKLNGSAGEILKRCDGQRSVTEITADLENTFNAQGLATDIEAFVRHAVEQGWLELRT